MSLTDEEMRALRELETELGTEWHPNETQPNRIDARCLGQAGVNGQFFMVSEYSDVRMVLRIVRMRDALPRLLDEIEQLREERSRAWEELRDVDHTGQQEPLAAAIQVLRDSWGHKQAALEGQRDAAIARAEKELAAVQAELDGSSTPLKNLSKLARDVRAALEYGDGEAARERRKIVAGLRSRLHDCIADAVERGEYEK